MDVNALQRHVKAAELPLDKLAGNANVPQQEKIAEVSRQFEAILLRQILGDAQKKMFGTSTSAGIYQDMTTAQLADKVSHSGGFGLAKHLEHQLGRELAPRADKSAGAPAPAQIEKLQHRATALVAPASSLPLGNLSDSRARNVRAPYRLPNLHKH